jgi:hypothetical protein
MHACKPEVIQQDHEAYYWMEAVLQHCAFASVLNVRRQTNSPLRVLGRTDTSADIV